MQRIDWDIHPYSNGVTVWTTHIGDAAVVYFAELDDGSGRAGVFALDDSDFHRAKGTVDKTAAEMLADRLVTRVHRSLRVPDAA